MVISSRFIYADRAFASGLISEVVEDDRLEEAVRELISDLLAASPMRLRINKEVLARASVIDDLAAAICLKEHAQLACMQVSTFTQSVSLLDGGRKVRIAREMSPPTL